METTTNKPVCIIIIGGPACGKGTNCKRLADEFGFVHLSIGDILRAERKKDTEEGRFIDFHMKQFEESGKLMPSEVIAQFLFKAMSDLGWEQKVFLVDGFIKAKGGYSCWKKMFEKVVTTKFVLYLECSRDVMLKRMKERSQTSGRLDDNDNLYENRINTFFERTYPCVELFSSQGLVEVVNTEQSMEDVYANVLDCVNKYFPFNSHGELK